MSIKKLVPWNWFKKEEENEHSVNVPNNNQENRLLSRNDPFTLLQKEVNNIFNSFGSSIFDNENSIFSSAERILKPNLDISESDKQYNISIEVPGVDEKDISLELSGNSLIVSGEKKQESETKDSNYHRVERSYGSFRRILSLPKDADAENIKATFRNGILNIKISRKAVAESNIKKITIN